MPHGSDRPGRPCSAPRSLPPPSRGCFRYRSRHRCWQAVPPFHRETARAAPRARRRPCAPASIRRTGSRTPRAEHQSRRTPESYGPCRARMPAPFQLRGRTCLTADAGHPPAARDPRRGWMPPTRPSPAEATPQAGPPLLSAPARAWYPWRPAARL